MVSSRPRRPKTGWLALRRELDPGRRAVLTLFSFLGPLLLWSAVSYLPFLWHPEIRLTVSADREGLTTVFTVGDRMSKGFFPEFRDGVASENEAVLAAREAGEPVSTGRRPNLKIIRHLGPWALANGLLEPAEAEDDVALLGLWKSIAEDDVDGRKAPLTPVNRAVVEANWAEIEKADDPLNPKSLPTEALLKLVPQGISSNPVYLPAPHEVVLTGWADLTAAPVGDAPSMRERLFHSIRIVFSGFLLAALIGVPVGVLCGTFDLFSRLFEPFIDFFRYMPAPAFSTLLVAIFGLYDAPKIGLVFVGTYFQLVLVVANTTREVDRSLIEAAQTLGANRRKLLGRVIVPGILPQLYNDLRILLGWAWTWLVIAELIGAKSGLTEFIETQGRWRNFDRVFPVIIYIGLIGFFTDQLLSWLRGFLFSWTGDGPGSGTRALGRILSAFPRWLLAGRETETGKGTTT